MILENNSTHALQQEEEIRNIGLKVGVAFSFAQSMTRQYHSRRGVHFQA